MNENGDPPEKKDLTSLMDLPLLPASEPASEPVPETPQDAGMDFSFDAPPAEAHLEALDPPVESSPDPSLPDPLKPDPGVLDQIRDYGEAAKEAPFDPGIRNPFDFRASGDFDAYARDKLLLFITENPIGLSSDELDLQIRAGRVFFPRISEFSGIKLIQELRDSGLSFSLKPSRNEDQASPPEQDLRFHHDSSAPAPATTDLPVLSPGLYDPAEYLVLDSIRIVQYLRAEILELEKSELLQDLLDRMTEGLKRRALRKGANALTSLEHQITPLRLPSQYQIEISASLLKRRDP